MRAQLIGSILFSFVAAVPVWADPTCSCTPSNDGVIRLSECTCDAGTDDVDLWNAALTAATNPTTHGFGVVQATANHHYVIDQPLVVASTFGGIIDGNDATLEWTGPYTPMGTPGTGNTSYGSIFVFSDTTQLVLKNILLVSTPAHRLWAAIEFNNGLPTVRDATLNIVDNVIIDGTNTSGLDYGITFAMRYSAEGGAYDQMNDQSTIRNTMIQNVMKAAISIQGQNSKHHRIMNVNGRAADNNGNYDSDDSDPLAGAIKGAAFVRLISGSFDSIGGYHGGFRNAEFFIWASSDPTTIIDSNSEGCAHFLRTPDGNASYLLPVTVLGGRFDITENGGPGLATDGRIIAWHRYGPLTINGLMVSGPKPNGLTFDPHFYLNPNSAVSGDNQPIPFDISYISFTGAGSTAWTLFRGSANARLATRGNLCYPASGGAQPCTGTPATNEMTETLKNKSLTDPTNLFPQTGVLTFSTGASVSTTRYCAPNSSTCDTTTEANVSLPVAANLKVKNLRCKASVATGSANKIWTMSVTKNGSSTGMPTCPISGATATCFDTTTSTTVTAADVVSLKFQATTSPAPPAAVIQCSLGVGP